MRNIEASPWLEKPELIEVKAANVDKKRVSEFNLFLSLKRVATEDKGGKGPAKDAQKSAAKKG
jgi:type IV pilus assembly protein PilN